METYLFYAYLKYAKKNKQSFWPKLLSRPVSVIIFFSLTLLSGVCGAIFAFLGWSIAALIGMVGEIVFGILFYNCFEKYHIDFCVEEYDKYKDYCLKLYKWIKQFGVQNRDEVQMLHDRVQTKIICLKEEEEHRKSRNDRWLQTLIIPIILAIITAVIANQKSIETVLTYVLTILMIFAIIYGLLIMITNIGVFPQKRQIRQMECFASDLQGVIDLIED